MSIKVTVNGEEKEFDKSEICIKEMLILNKVQSPDMVSVQLNGKFVKKEEFDKVSVKDGDAIDFLYFMGGGGYGY